MRTSTLFLLGSLTALSTATPVARKLDEPYTPTTQQPLLLAHDTANQHTVTHPPTFAELALTAPGIQNEIRIHLQLGHRVTPSTHKSLPNHPLSARLIGAHTHVETERDGKKVTIDGGAPSPQEKHIICVMRPVISPEERSMRASRDGSGKRKAVAGKEDEKSADALSDELSVWFMVRDGEVEFENPARRWFLAGREVESYECY